MGWTKSFIVAFVLVAINFFFPILYVQNIDDTVEKIATTTQTTQIVEKPQDEAPVGLQGVASYYDYTLDSGWSSIGHFVCATRDFERYSCVKATNVANGRSVYCKVTDYGPDESIFPERVIDLSSTSFSAISSTKLGIADVIVEQAEDEDCVR